MNARERAMARALGSMIVLLEITANGCGHARHPRQLCGVCAMGARRALNEAKKAMRSKGEQ